MKAGLARMLQNAFGDLPVPVLAGLNRGRWWTLYPFSAYWRGGYERQLQRIMRDHLPSSGEAAWDLGAHFGFYSVTLAGAVGKWGHVLAVEPSQGSFAKLQRHKRLNRMWQLFCLNAAVSDRTGVAPLVGGGSLTSPVNHLPYFSEIVERSEHRQVPTVCLDELVEEGETRLPSFAKVDVEGHAAQALAGARQTLKKSRPTILLSLHSPEEAMGVQEICAPIGYKVWDLNGDQSSWEALRPGTEFLLRSG